MNRLQRIALVLLLTASSGAAQPGEPDQTGRQEQSRSLEALRKEALRRVQRMRAVFEEQLSQALLTLSEVRPDRDTQEAFETRVDMARWASVFPERFAALIKKSTEYPQLQTQLCRVLALAGSAGAADALAGLIGIAPELDLEIVRSLAVISAAGDGPRARLVELSQNPPSADVFSASIIAMARLEIPGAAALARTTIANTNASPQVVASAVRALAITRDDLKRDLSLLKKLGFEKDLDKAVRIAVLRALGSYERNTESRRILHQGLETQDDQVIAAAVHGLRTIASKESSKAPLLKLIRTTVVDRRIREDAARLLMALGIKDGARALVLPNKRAADAEPRNAYLQREVGEAYKRLNNFDDAISYFEKAIRQSNAARRYELRVWVARCRALQGQFDKAATELKKAGYDSFASFADDEDFASMAKHPRWAAMFRKKNDSGKK